jgi:hypothetical protein
VVFSFNRKPMKTKVIIAMSALAMSMVSCNKTYTCQCVETDTYYPGDEDVTTYTTPKMSESDAKALCDADDYSSTYQFGGVTYTEKQECSLK